LNIVWEEIIKAIFLRVAGENTKRRLPLLFLEHQRRQSYDGENGTPTEAEIAFKFSSHMIQKRGSLQ
jgi:hypothetical protein